MRTKLPEIRNRINPNEHHINATPEGYPLRILRYYRLLCDSSFIVSGLPKEKVAIYDLMNQHQIERAKELDKAIEILTKDKNDKDAHDKS